MERQASAIKKTPVKDMMLVPLNPDLAGLYSTPNGELLIQVAVNGSKITGQVADSCEHILKVQGKAYQKETQYFKGFNLGKEIHGKIHIMKLDSSSMTGIREPTCMKKFRDHWDEAIFYSTTKYSRQQIYAKYKSRSMNMACKVNEVSLDTVFLSKFTWGRETFRNNCVQSNLMSPQLKSAPMIMGLPDMQPEFEPPEPPPVLLLPDKLSDVIK